MKRLIVFAVLFGFLGLGPASDAAQGPHPGAGPVVDDERMGQMMKMMGEMREQMKGMRQQMQGMGPMHGRMEHMMGEMGRMRTMMEQHRGQMMKECPGAAPSAAPSK